MAIRNAEDLMLKTLRWELGELTGIAHAEGKVRDGESKILLKEPSAEFVNKPDSPTESVLSKIAPPFINISYYDEMDIKLSTLQGYRKNLIPTSGPTGIIIEFNPNARIRLHVEVSVFGNSTKQVDGLVNDIILWAATTKGLPLRRDILGEYMTVFPEYTREYERLSEHKLFKRGIMLCLEGQTYQEVTGYVTNEIFVRLYAEEGLVFNSPRTRRIEVLFNVDGFVEMYDSANQYLELGEGDFYLTEGFSTLEEYLASLDTGTFMLLESFN